MRTVSLTFLLMIFLLTACGDSSPVRKENRPRVDAINKTVHLIDGNHRVQIIEDDFHEGDSIFKIRAYYMESELIKIVNILRTAHFERDDYFYFDDEEIIFSGHMWNERDQHIAAEYKYYYDDGKIFESLFWEDSYVPGQRFPHEKFAEFEPNVDSLISMEKDRLSFCLSKLAVEGVEILHYNEYIGAN